jgi:hypothetical protein
MECIVWRSGEPAERSKREDRPTEEIDHSTDAVNVALENQQPIDMVDLSLRQADCLQNSNMRETVNNKLSERELIGQVGQNPFFTQNSYSMDLDIQEAYLRPQSSHVAGKDSR